MKIRSGDLKHPAFYFLYSCSEWQTPLKGPRLKHLYFSVREETGDEILTIIFKRTDKGKPISPQGLFPLSAWGYHTQAKLLGKLFSQVFPGDPYGAYRRLLRAFAYLKIPRYHIDPESGEAIPWRYRRDPSSFIIARSLVTF